MNTHALRVKIYGLELDAETLKRDPIANRRELRALARVIADLRHRLGRETGREYPVAVDLCFYDKTVRVIADNQWEAKRIVQAWLSRHPGGGSIEQHAAYSAWAKSLLASLHQQQERKSA